MGKIWDTIYTARKAITVRSVLPYAAALGIAFGFTRDIGTVAGLAFGFAIVGGIQLLRDVPSIDDRWVGVGIGLFVTCLSLAWLGYELTIAAGTGGPAWFPALTTLIGVWFLLDAREDFHSGGHSNSEARPDADLTTSELMLVMNHLSLIVDELKQGPKTIDELAAACDLTESRVREGIEVVAADDTVYRVEPNSVGDAPRYALDESRVGGLAFVRVNGMRAARRLVRPFRR